MRSRSRPNDGYLKTGSTDTLLLGVLAILTMLATAKGSLLLGSGIRLWFGGYDCGQIDCADSARTTQSIEDYLHEPETADHLNAMPKLPPRGDHAALGGNQSGTRNLPRAICTVFNRLEFHSNLANEQHEIVNKWRDKCKTP